MDVVWALQLSHWRDGGLVSAQQAETAVIPVSVTQELSLIPHHTALPLVLGLLKLISVIVPMS